MTKLIDGLVEQMIGWRRQMHSHPETGFDVHETAGLIASLLKEWGLEVHEGIGQTGVVGVLRKGNRPDCNMIALRADTDALPIIELNTFHHRSKIDGKMHGCGHDGHSAMLLGAARQLAEYGEFEGTVVFIFQPNEEHGLGAQAMIDDGLFERFPATEVYGMHNLPGLAAGVLAMRAGAIMASESLFEIRISGCGGHASSPHLVDDPIIPATQLIQGLQTIVSRTVDPLEAVVVSVTEVLTDGARNVIPSTVTLKGDCRTFNDATTDQVEQRIRTLASGIGDAFGAQVEVTFSHEFFVTHNARAPTQAAECAALKVNGPDRVVLDVPPKSFSEDFACLQRVVPGCYVFLGNGTDSQGGCMLHNPHYDFNDNVLETGARYWTALVEQQLQNQGVCKMLNKNRYLTHYHNPKANKDAPYTDAMRSILSASKAREAMEDIQHWPGYSVTPLHELAGLAEQVEVGKLFYKDESTRFELKSFKSLGGSYAVAKQLLLAISRETGEQAQIEDLFSGKYAEVIRKVTVATATDGNHGRSVAWGARMFGCACVIYIHADVSVGRERSMAELGAEVIRITGNYDDSVKEADQAAKENGWIIVSDNSYEGYMEIPKDVALGYSVMLLETVNQLDGQIPSHVFIQGGCGGLASAVCGFFWDLWGDQRPRLIVVEPEQANCLQLSAVEEKLMVVDGKLDTLMAGLACGEVSLLAWEILETGADDFTTVAEPLVPESMRLLAKGCGQDSSVEAGESAVAGIAALLGIKGDQAMQDLLGLDGNSSVLIIGTEGATDPELYQQILNGEH